MKNRIFFLLTASLLSCIACNNIKKHYTEAEIKSESKKANTFFEKSFDNMLDRNPMYQTYLGIKTDYDKWDDLSEEFAEQDFEITKKELQYLLDSINYNALDYQTAISYKLFKSDLENEIEGFKYRHYNYPVNQMLGWHTRIPSFLINMHVITTEDDAKAYIERIKKVPYLMDQIISELNISEEKGIMPPEFVYPWCIEAAQNIVKGRPFEGTEHSALLADFYKKVSTLEISDHKKDSLQKACNIALKTNFLPAYDTLIAYLSDQETRATNDHGVWKFPDGENFYNYILKVTTTTNLTSDEIYNIGLKEVERIHDEMNSILKKVSYEGSLYDFFKFMKTDSQFYYPNTEEGKQAYLDSAKSIINNMEARLDEIFITKPKASLKVKRVEAFREKSAGKAFYQPASPDGSRPGMYYVNLYDTRNMPKYEMEALAYHEGLPGHHMDRSISQELDDLPRFRKHGGYTAYIEGWGLYSEYLPKEMGMYQDPYADFGRLSAELWRACRLVVDCGIHAKKWTRQQGIDYYLKNTPASERECERMVERHIVMPSQATAYKIGMLKILELRNKAQEKLGDTYVIRKFHEVVLTNGAVPLDVLEELVNNWINSN